jgi:hypothetical protein
VAKQKFRQLMARGTLGPLGAIPTAFQITHRLGRSFGPR